LLTGEAIGREIEVRLLRGREVHTSPAVLAARA
jgi:hypothetical protein